MTGSNWMHDWRGLHNHERHVEAAEGVYCLLVHSGCGDWCFPDRYCRCCLLVEFERLTAERDALKANVVQAIDTDGVADTACRCAEPDDTPDGMLHDAWSVIANAPVRGWGFSGLANKQEQEWIDAAKRWRDAWHKTLNPEPVPDDYEPVPQWRVLANAGVRNLTSEDPLTVVLRSLANVADPNKVTSANLARIIAVAEREVGDGWQVDPDRTYRDGEMNALWLNDALGLWNKSGNARWKVLGCRAADWLRDLTEDEAS